MTSKHILRPSNMERSLACPGSVILSEGLPDNMPDYVLQAANLGSCAHLLLEACVNGEADPEGFVGLDFDISDDGEDAVYEYVTDEMADNVRMFLDVIADEMHLEHYSELFHKHSVLAELEGTTDFVSWNPLENLITISDLKYGTGSVSVRKRNGDVNKQLMSYAALMADKFPEAENFKLRIVQPRRTTIKKVLEHTVTRAEVDSFLIKVGGIKGTRLKEGGHCFFCRASGICPLKKESQLARDFG